MWKLKRVLKNIVVEKCRKKHWKKIKEKIKKKLY